MCLRAWVGLPVDRKLLNRPIFIPQVELGGSHRRAVVATSAALIGENGIRNVTTAVDIGSKSWPFDIRLRPWGFRPGPIGSKPIHRRTLVSIVCSQGTAEGSQCRSASTATGLCLQK